MLLLLGQDLRGNNMKNEEKYYELKSKIESDITEFIEICIDVNREWENEVNDVLADGQKGAGIKDIRQLI